MTNLHNMIVTWFSPQPAPVEAKRLVSIRVDAWTTAQLTTLRDQWPTRRAATIAYEVGRTVSSVRSKASELGLRKSRAAFRAILLVNARNRRDAWREDELQYLRDQWPTLSATEIGRVLGRSANAVKNKGSRELGLCKTRDEIRAVNKRNRNHTQFQKGGLPHNTIHGDALVIVTRRNKNRPAYQWVRVGFKTWKMYHVYLWEQVHGPVPDGHIVVFMNGDPADCRLENLELISKKVNMKRNNGAVRLSDGFVASTMAGRDRVVKKTLLQHPELIELKRAQLQLDRAIRHDKSRD